jgi:hypothetical protein
MGCSQRPEDRTAASIAAALDADTATRAREFGAHMSEDQATAFTRTVIDEARHP